MKVRYRHQLTPYPPDELATMTFVMRRTEEKWNCEISTSVTVAQFKQFFQRCKQAIKWVSLEFETEMYFWSHEMGWYKKAVK